LALTKRGRRLAIATARSPKQVGVKSLQAPTAPSGEQKFSPSDRMDKQEQVEMKKYIFALGSISLALVPPPASAHHSGAMFDREKEIVLTGTIKELEWTNPHTWIEMMAPDASGKPVQWSIEMEAPNSMYRRGWSASTVKEGDKVTVLAHPLKDGRTGGAYISIKLPDGKMLGRGAEPAAR
jgi:hypothetical protein